MDGKSLAADLLRRAARIGNRIEERFDAAKFAIKVRRGWLDRVEILPYRGHGTREALFLKGRVLEASGITRSTTRDTAIKNVRNMAGRFFSDEIPGATVRARYGDLVAEATTTSEGFFDVRFDLPNPPAGSGPWHPVELELLGPFAPGQKEARATGTVLVPQNAEFGVISDLDDTVLHSSATNVAKMTWIVVVNNAYTRLPFEGVAAFYHALQRGSGVPGEARNPVFYVSSSPWNIYDLLEDFMDVHGVPAGPIFLKDWSPTVLGKHDQHKLGIIRTLFKTYPGLPFVLIGDSGERDPEIYARAVAEHPGRVRAIFIRDVTTPERDREVHAIAENLAREHGVEMALVPDTARAADHAASSGLISPETVPGIKARSASPGR